MKRVILVDPQEKEDDYREIPLGLIIIATSLKEKSYETLLVKGSKEKPEKLSNYFTDDTVFFAFGVKTCQVNTALTISKYLKKKYGDTIKILWGGPHVNLYPKQVLENENIDIIVFGDGDETILEVATALEDKKTLKGIKGCGFKNGKEIIINDARGFTDISKLPKINYTIVPEFKKYVEGSKRISLKPNESFMPILSGVGCVFNCTFCYNTMQKSRRSNRSIKDMLTEIKFLQENYGINLYGIVDELFLDNKDRVKEFLREKRKMGLKFEWDTTAHINFLSNELLYTDDFLKEMKDEGLILFGLGVESGSIDQLKRYRKNITVESVIKVAKRMDKLQIPTSYLFMIGAPYETYDDMLKSVKLAYKIKAISPKYSQIWNMTLFRPVPNVEIYNDAIKLGYNEKKTLEDYEKAPEFVGYVNMEDLPYLQPLANKIKNIIYYMRIIKLIFDSKNKYLISFFRSSLMVDIMSSRFAIGMGGAFVRRIFENNTFDKHFSQRVFRRSLKIFE